MATRTPLCDPSCRAAAPYPPAVLYAASCLPYASAPSAAALAVLLTDCSDLREEFRSLGCE
jgi:hypothetical protein